MIVGITIAYLSLGLISLTARLSVFRQVYLIEVPDLDLLVCVVWSINRKESSYYRISFIFLTKDGRIVDESNN